jgi:hypothetical protein
MISSGEVNAKDEDFEVICSLVSDRKTPVYTRGIAVAALGTCLATNTSYFSIVCDRSDNAAFLTTLFFTLTSSSQLQDLVIMDSLIDLIGFTKSSDPASLGLRLDHVFTLPLSPCCLL